MIPIITITIAIAMTMTMSMMMMVIRMVDFAPFLVDLTQKCGLNNLVLTKRLAKVDLATQLWTKRLFCVD